MSPARKKATTRRAPAKKPLRKTAPARKAPEVQLKVVAATVAAQSGPPIKDVEGLMAYAYALEAEASERYSEFADAMETHNNREVAELFRKLARIENMHAEQILEEMGWTRPPAPPTGGWRWEGLEGPETADHTDLHYLMQPYHALQIALHNEKRAEAFFRDLIRRAPSGKVRTAAKEMADEETEHVRLVEEWLKRTPKPESDWAHDPDPPRWSD
ncbi:MAG: ferritin family protein [Burkholderiales bacterium]|nr:ferritin family protein [Burkholderiales bacterium]